MTSLTPSHRSPLRRTATAIAALTLAAVAVLAGPALSASAHDELVTTDPAVDSVVTEAPTSVSLTFSAELLSDAGASEMQVLDASGAQVQEGTPVTEGPTVTQALGGELANGQYRVLWKVVSSDGHPTSGEFAFTLDAAGEGPSAAPSETPTSEPSETAAPLPSASTSPAPEPDTTTAQALPWVIIGIVAIAIGGAVVYLLIARARRLRDAETLRADRSDAATPTGSDADADR